MFNLDGVIWDSALHAVADNKDTGEVYYRLPDISDVSIDISADTKDSVDKDGALIKRSYTAKAATVTLTNTHLVLGAYAGTTGSKKIMVDTVGEMEAPKMLLVDPSKADFDLPDEPVTGTVSVTPIYKDGGTGKSFTLSDGEADENTKFQLAAKKITFPTKVKDNAEIVQLLLNMSTSVKTLLLLRIMQINSLKQFALQSLDYIVTHVKKTFCVLVTLYSQASSQVQRPQLL